MLSEKGKEVVWIGTDGMALFHQYLDPLLIAIWYTMVYLKISFFFYLSAFILAQIFRLKDHPSLNLLFSSYYRCDVLSFVRECRKSKFFHGNHMAKICLFCRVHPYSLFAYGHSKAILEEKSHQKSRRLAKFAYKRAWTKVHALLHYLAQYFIGD